MANVIPFRQPNQTGQAVSQSRILAVAQNDLAREGLDAVLSTSDYDVQFAADLSEASRCLSQLEFDACLIDLDAAGNDVPAFCRRSSCWRRPTSLLGTASPGLLSSAQLEIPAEMELILKPYSPQRLIGRLAETVVRHRLRNENARLRHRANQRLYDELVGQSESVEVLRKQIQSAGEHDAPVLVRGEPGTGTTLVARAIHLSSGRSDGPLAAVDCSLQTTACLEQALFGNRSAQFLTSSGRPAPAAGGTLIVENIEAASLPLQKKLAELFTKHAALGPDRRSDRLIAVSHAWKTDSDPDGLFDAGLADLLRGQTIRIPPLRERREDIAPLSEFLLHRLAVQEGQAPRRMTLDALQLLRGYNWPGNVTQLWNVIYRAGSLEESELLTADMLRPWLDDTATASSGFAPGMTLREMERKLIEATFNRCHGNRERTAQLLSIGLRTLSGKLREYGYPPRGGPGSNRKLVQPKLEQRKAA